MLFKRSKSRLGNPRLPAAGDCTIIALGTIAEGKIVSDDEVQILGSFHGRIDAKICVVGENAVVEGEIDAEDILVYGEVIGPLRAYHILLAAGSHVRGNVTSTTIEVDNRARLNGSVWRTKDPFGATAAARPVDFLQAGPAEELPVQEEEDSGWAGSAIDNYRPVGPNRTR